MERAGELACSSPSEPEAGNPTGGIPGGAENAPEMLTAAAMLPVSARILYIDLETSPNIADVWGLWDQNIGLSQLRESSRMIGFAAKWKHEKTVRWYGEDKHDHATIVKQAHRLYDKADIVVTYNGDRFDTKHLNAEWAIANLTPPAPVQSIDLFKVVKKEFKFPSNKLQYVASRLIGDTKVSHSGHQMWRDCLDPGVDPKVRAQAWTMMARYCKQDTALLEPLHEKLLPWLPAKVNMALFAEGDDIRCQKCGSDDLRKDGKTYTATRAYQAYKCRACGGYTRDRRAATLAVA